ncbi:DUF302 domain-containing protein [Parvularcula flava]|uniref:DUF302 domain-containing protein n=1 Tax=Aquisalinus luteolus TaxID=1566827 RepID=A0A8J3EQI6_9PROT|nr:DUF302 domain-containing protein [Aquisalinus luteolus]NHK27018.1 DUF302 domain-containing protein [Aquisalinus luteolus]GGH94115.1 hypothetical protein GCM10011355_07540 [Aquisalinus luteolus]
MSYYFAKTISASFEDAIEQVTAALRQEGFGVLTEIDVSATMKKKLDKDFRPYRILGACNPQMAWQALQAEDKIGVMLPCNVIVQKIANDEIEIAAVDPVASMSSVENENLGSIAADVRSRLQKVIESLK